MLRGLPLLRFMYLLDTWYCDSPMREPILTHLGPCSFTNLRPRRGRSECAVATEAEAESDRERERSCVAVAGGVPKERERERSCVAAAGGVPRPSCVCGQVSFMGDTTSSLGEKLRAR